MMYTINYKWTKNENKSMPNNNYSEETQAVVVSEGYDFGDWLQDNGVKFEEENNTFYVLDDEGNRTGEAYQITEIETTMTVYGRPITDEDMANIASYMDDEIREQVHSELAPCEHEEFIRRYLEEDPDFIALLHREFEFETAKGGIYGN